MSYASAFDIVGLVLNLLGVSLLFVFGMPCRVRTGTGLPFVLEQASEKIGRAERWYDVFGWLGFALIVTGTAAQIKAVFL